ncbi:LysR family transcriptional regulator [bacterium]|nr:LysR family transcriptional regulator [bacterium]
MISFTQLEYLVAVDKFRHFRRASEACLVTQPTLSMQLQKLEEELGGALFDRSRKPVIPTDRGKLIIEQAKVVLEQRDVLQDLAGQSEGGVRGTLRVGLIATLAPYLLPRMLTHFTELYPKVQLLVEESKTEVLLRKLNDEELDAVVCAGPLPDSDLQKKHLFYEKFYVYSSSRVKQFKKSTLKPSDLDPSKMWHLDEGHCLREQSLKLCSSKQKQLSINNIDLRVDTLETLKNLVSSGEGYTLLPALSLDYLFSGSVSKKVYSFEAPQPARQIVLVYKRKQLKMKLIEAFVDEVLRAVPEKRVSFSRQGLRVVAI